MATTKFEINGVYMTRSACDYECIWRYRVTRRTAKTITIHEIGRVCERTCRVYEYNGVEQVRPQGSFSMCPILSADNHNK